MSEDDRKSNSKSTVVHPVRHSIEEILKHVYPAPDEETDRFIAEIYEDRRRSAGVLPSE
jgi:hypothetical protein